METYTLGEIAARVGGTVRGEAGRRVEGIKPLEQAGPEDLTFLAHPRYRRAAAASRAAGVLVSEAERLPGHNLIVVGNPYAALARIIDLFHSPERPGPGLSPEAVIEPGVRIGEGVHVGPCAVVGRGSILGDRTIVMPGVVLGEKVTVGDDAVLHPGVVVYRDSVIGDRVVIHAGSVIGSDGFGYAEEGGSRTKIPQVGNVVIEDDVEIGACATIDRATFGSTMIGRGTKIDNLVQVAHNAVIGEGSVLVAQSGIAGSTRLGRAVILAGQAGVAGHLTIGDGAIVGAKSAALRDLEANAFVVGNPAEDHRAWKRSQAALRRLPDLLHRVARLERTLEAAAVQGPTAPGRAKRAAGRPAPRRAKRRSG